MNILFNYLSLFYSIASVIVTIICYFKLMKKIGNPSFYTWFLLIPYINLFLLIIIIFTKWPIEEELQEYKNKFGEN